MYNIRIDIIPKFLIHSMFDGSVCDSWVLFVNETGRALASENYGVRESTTPPILDLVYIASNFLCRSREEIRRWYFLRAAVSFSSLAYYNIL